MLINALTIDVEDWFHPELVRYHLGSTALKPMVSETIQPILALLKRYEVKATFFVVGEVALRFPRLIYQIYEEGHEVGFHGMSHRMLKEMGEDGLRKELKDFKDLIRKVLGEVKIKGFRAPTFSLNQDTKWALPILKHFGYLYDSSIFPTKFFLNPLYGMEKAPRFPYRISFKNPEDEDPNSPLWEFPAAILQIGGFRLPVGGGFYLRALPLSFVKRALGIINREGPFHLYLHPWECNEMTPRIRLPFFSRWVTYYGMGKILLKLEELIKRFPFTRMDEVLENVLHQGG